MCDDDAVLLVALALVSRLVRRVRPMSLALALYETWRRLPPEQRQRLVLAARQNAPRVASSLTRRGRPPS